MKTGRSFSGGLCVGVFFLCLAAVASGCGGGGGGDAPDTLTADLRADLPPDVVPSDARELPPDAVPEQRADVPEPDPCAAVPSVCPPLSHVDTRIGSGDIGYRLGAVFVGAAAPFGMMKAGPDTSHSTLGRSGVFHYTGYFYPDDLVLGFSHTHMHGTGAVDYGDILVMPTSDFGVKQTRPEDFASKFKHENEIGTAGYYSVLLERFGIQAEITASTHGAHHRYTWPAGKTQTVLLDAAYVLPGCNCDGAEVEFDAGTGVLSGFKKNRGALSGRFGGYTVWFEARFSRAPASFGTYTPGTVNDGVAKSSGCPSAMWFTFDAAQSDRVELQIAISFVDPEGAAGNLAAELTGRPFEDVYASVRDAWAELIGVVEAEFDEQRLSRIFYTALYHTALMPIVFSDADGRYVGFDREVHTADWGPYYSDFSLWDTFRTPHPLYVLLWPDRQLDMLRSLVTMKEQGGYLPKWPMCYGYTNCMVGTSADMVVADSYLKGLTDFDFQSAFEGMLDTATGPTDPGSGYGGRGGILEYIALHYVPGDNESGSVSKTQEYAYADFCIGKMAGALGKADIEQEFLDRGTWYANLWDPQSGFFRGKNADGSFMEPFKPLVWQDMYVEGDAWQYLFYAPHDPAGLADLMGGWDGLIGRLDELFVNSDTYWNDIIPSSYYFHGNEPDIHTPFLYSFAGDPDRAGKWSAWVADRNYDDTGAGLAGNDDAGTLSAWYVFAALGFFPIACTNEYALYAPLATSATVHLPGGDLAVSVTGQGQYLSGISLGEAPLSAAVVSHEDLVSGGTLAFQKGSAPGAWSTVP
jgi:predicted alpha-1,2-mannosidase